MTTAHLSVQQAMQLYLQQLQALGMQELYLPQELLQQALPASNQEKLDQLHDSIRDCRLCTLCNSRTQVVFGVGNAQANLVFVGEAPGGDEDKQGFPFVGRAGQLLTRMIENGMGLKRSDVYICNVVKCRPPQNRDPKLDEIAACEPFLKQQLDIIKPKVIVALGKFAAQTLLQTTESISRLRGRWTEYHGIPLMPTFHPSYLLRGEDSPDRGRDARMKVWEDLQKVMTELGIPLPKKGEK